VDRAEIDPITERFAATQLDYSMSVDFDSRVIDLLLSREGEWIDLCVETAAWQAEDLELKDARAWGNWHLHPLISPFLNDLSIAVISDWDRSSADRCGDHTCAVPDGERYALAVRMPSTAHCRLAESRTVVVRGAPSSDTDWAVLDAVGGRDLFLSLYGAQHVSIEGVSDLSPGQVEAALEIAVAMYASGHVPCAFMAWLEAWRTAWDGQDLANLASVKDAFFAPHPAVLDAEWVFPLPLLDMWPGDAQLAAVPKFENAPKSIPAAWWMRRLISLASAAWTTVDAAGVTLENRFATVAAPDDEYPVVLHDWGVRLWYLLEQLPAERQKPVTIELAWSFLTSVGPERAVELALAVMRP